MTIASSQCCSVTALKTQMQLLIENDMDGKALVIQPALRCNCNAATQRGALPWK